MAVPRPLPSSYRPCFVRRMRAPSAWMVAVGWCLGFRRRAPKYAVDVDAKRSEQHGAERDIASRRRYDGAYDGRSASYAAYTTQDTWLWLADTSTNCGGKDGLLRHLSLVLFYRCPHRHLYLLVLRSCRRNCFLSRPSLAPSVLSLPVPRLPVWWPFSEGWPDHSLSELRRKRRMQILRFRGPSFRIFPRMVFGASSGSGPESLAGRCWWSFRKALHLKMRADDSETGRKPTEKKSKINEMRWRGTRKDEKGQKEIKTVQVRQSLCSVYVGSKDVPTRPCICLSTRSQRKNVTCK